MVNWSVGVCVHGNRGYQSYSTDFNDAVCCVWSLLFSIEFVKEGWGLVPKFISVEYLANVTFLIIIGTSETLKSIPTKMKKSSAQKDNFYLFS